MVIRHPNLDSLNHDLPVREEETDMENPIRLADYPQLRLIAWNRRAEDLVSDEEALALYERNWRHIDQGSLQPAERHLIDRLIRTVGKGVLHV